VSMAGVNSSATTRLDIEGNVRTSPQGLPTEPIIMGSQDEANLLAEDSTENLVYNWTVNSWITERRTAS
jgi:hypothetical protein